jgi:hypothetical protein
MNKIVLTFDLDWCTDEVLQYTLDKLITNNIAATFFVTHETVLLDKIRKYDFFELGIHPNFHRNTTHGDSVDSIISYCCQLVPEAISSRSHGLNISSDKLISMMNYGIKIDCSIFMPNISKLQNFKFIINDKKILRIPYNWEDDYEFYQKKKKYKYINIQHMEDKIIDFHPIHVFLNSNSETNYNEYKLNNNIVKNKGRGSETMLDEIINEHINGNIKIINLKTFIGFK